MTAKRAEERDKEVIFKNCAPFTDHISKISNTQVDHVRDVDVMIPIYNLIEYSDNNSKTSGLLWQYYRYEPNDNLTNSKSFKYKAGITGKIPDNDNLDDVKIAVPLKYLSTLCRTLEMSLINCEINLILTWSENCVISYVSIVTLSSKDNTKLLQQLKSGFRRTINWNKYQSKISTERLNQYLDYLTDPGFQEVNRFFVLSFESNAHRTRET